MLKNILFVVVIAVSGLMAQWPSSISEYQKSICLVEFYQPQYEEWNFYSL